MEHHRWLNEVQRIAATPEVAERILCLNADTKPTREFPRLCRGGSKSLTYPAVDTAAPSMKLGIVSRQAHEEGVR
jgi:hypothetical protein